MYERSHRRPGRQLARHPLPNAEQFLGLSHPRRSNRRPHERHSRPRGRERWVLFLPQDGILRAVHAAGPTGQHLTGTEIRLGEGTSGSAAATGVPARRTGLACERGIAHSPAFAGFRSVLAWPLVHNAQTLAVLSLYRRSEEPLSPEAIGIVDAACYSASAALHLALEHEWYRRTSGLDRQTGLPNSRELFLRLDAELSRCQRTGAGLSVLVCRLQGPRVVPDGILARLGLYFRNRCRDYDYVGWTGERFVVLLPGASGTRPDFLAGLPDIRPFQLTVASVSYPADGFDAEDLLAAADLLWSCPSLPGMG